MLCPSPWAPPLGRKIELGTCALGCVLSLLSPSQFGEGVLQQEMVPVRGGALQREEARVRAAALSASQVRVGTWGRACPSSARPRRCAGHRQRTRPPAARTPGGPAAAAAPWTRPPPPSAQAGTHRGEGQQGSGARAPGWLRVNRRQLSQMWTLWQEAPGHPPNPLLVHAGLPEPPAPPLCPPAAPALLPPPTPRPLARRAGTARTARACPPPRARPPHQTPRAARAGARPPPPGTTPPLRWPGLQGVLGRLLLGLLGQLLPKPTC